VAVIRVLVVDDEAIVRAAIRSVLESDPAITVQAEAADADEGIALTRALRPDVVLMDIRMPKTDGMSATTEIRRIRPNQPVVIVTTFGDDQYIDRAVALGVNGFLIKSGDPHDLIRGVKAAAAGGASISPAVAAYLLRTPPNHRSAISARGAREVGKLTARELDVLRLLARGYSNAEIGGRLHLVESTVKGYLTAIFLHLGVRNRVEAALVAYDAGIARGE
jgi:DNA-binding NarL/FixJ family response regulator